MNKTISFPVVRSNKMNGCKYAVRLVQSPIYVRFNQNFTYNYGLIGHFKRAQPNENAIRRRFLSPFFLYIT